MKIITIWLEYKKCFTIQLLFDDSKGNYIYMMKSLKYVICTEYIVEILKLIEFNLNFGKEFYQVYAELKIILKTVFIQEYLEV